VQRLTDVAKIGLVVICILLVLVILLQSGRSAGLGALTGGGNEAGSGRRGTGTDPILAKFTTGFAIVFYVLGILIAWLVSH
jgi:preprotein translocase subunit SecG